MPAIVNFLTPALGPNIIEVIDTGGNNEIEVLEIFSEWKDWLLADAGVRLGYPQAFTVIGGEPKSPTLNLGQAFFLHPEWKIRPAERDHRLVVNGDIQVLGGVGRVTADTVGAFTVEVSFTVSALLTGLNLANPLTTAQTAAAVWDEAAASHVAAGTTGETLDLLRKVHTNRLDAAVGDPGTLILYDDDGTTPLKTWNLRDYLAGAVVGTVGSPALRGAAT